MGTQAVQRKIVGYHQDQAQHWVAELDCGHFQHVRHNPPLISREWVTSEKGRKEMLGFELLCKKCAEGLAPDKITTLVSLKKKKA